MEISQALEPQIFKKDLSKYGQIIAIEISPFVLSQDVVLIAFESRVLVGHLIFDDNLDLKILAEFEDVYHGSALTISPETSISLLPNLIIFGVAGNDHKLKVFRSNLQGDDVCKILNGHSSYINDVNFDYDNNFLASTADDHTVRLWETEDLRCVATFQLTSPGMSVCWQREDNSKLLVAEKIGLLRFYNVETQSLILSLDYGKPLSSSHWAASDSQLVASLQLGELLVWDLSKPCIPINNNIIFTETGGHIRFSPFGELIATVNSLDGSMKIIHVQTNQLKLSASVMLPSNISWHCRYPIVCVGDYMTLTFWKVTSN